MIFIVRLCVFCWDSYSLSQPTIILLVGWGERNEPQQFRLTKQAIFKLIDKLIDTYGRYGIFIYPLDPKHHAVHRR